MHFLILLYDQYKNISMYIELSINNCEYSKIYALCHWGFCEIFCALNQSKELSPFQLICNCVLTLCCKTTVLCLAPNTCLTPPHSLCPCQSQAGACNSVYRFIHKSGRLFCRLNYSTSIVTWPFMACYGVWVLHTIEGCTVTFLCLLTSMLFDRWSSVVSLSRIPHILIVMLCN